MIGVWCSAEKGDMSTGFSVQRFSTRSRMTNWCLLCVYAQEGSLAQSRSPHRCTRFGAHMHNNKLHKWKERVMWEHSAGRCALWRFSKTLYCLGCCSAISQLRVYRHGENKLNSLLTLLCLHPTFKWIALNEKWIKKHQIDVKEEPGIFILQKSQEMDRCSLNNKQSETDHSFSLLLVLKCYSFLIKKVKEFGNDCGIDP